MDTQRIVVLGGGYGGVEACKTLLKLLKKRKDVQITLIDKNPYHTLMTELHEIAGSRTEAGAVQVSFKRIFGGTRLEVISDEIQNIDFDAKTLVSDTQKYNYDYLVLGTGGSPEFFGTPGVQENSFTLWSLEDAIRIREHIEIRFREAAKEPDPEKRKFLLTFTVAGAGFTGIELVGELIERADTLCRTYHIDRSEVDIQVIEAKDTILPILPPKPQKAAQKYLAKKHVTLMVNAPITKAEEGKVFLADGRVINTGTFIWTCGIQASQFTAKITLTKGRVSNDKCSVASPEGIHGMAGCHFDEDERYIVGERGRILVNEYMQSVDHPEVYLCGDMIWFLQEEKVLPQIVETALQTAEIAAFNVVASLEKKDRKPLHTAYHGFMVSIGGKYGVAHVMGMSMYGFFAMAMKHVVNLHYLWGLAGINACWGYLQEEFFQMKNRRTFIGGHLAAKIPAYWALPARLWLGFMWVVEGINKIGEGWLNFSAGTKSSWMFSAGVTQAGIETVNAVAAASEATGDAASTAVAAAAQVSDAVAAASEAVSSTSSAVATAASSGTWGLDMTLPIFSPDSGIVTWFRQTFMDGIFAYLPYQFFQVMIVGTETLIGLALLGGLFTFPAAVVSIGMCVIFTLSGMFTWTQLWFVFLALVMFGGAGQVAGLDYWVLPWLRDKWASWGFIQRHHLYSDEPIMKKKKRQ